MISTAPDSPEIGQTWISDDSKEYEYSDKGWSEVETICVEVQAFKRGGKYYSTYIVECKPKKIWTEDKLTFTYYMQNIFDAVESAIKDGKIPTDFVYYVNLDDGYPGLVNL